MLITRKRGGKREVSITSDAVANEFGRARGPEWHNKCAHTLGLPCLVGESALKWGKMGAGGSVWLYRYSEQQTECNGMYGR